MSKLTTMEMRVKRLSLAYELQEELRIYCDSIIQINYWKKQQINTSRYYIMLTEMGLDRAETALAIADMEISNIRTKLYALNKKLGFEIFSESFYEIKQQKRKKK